jgi:hypothetical protein
MISFGAATAQVMWPRLRTVRGIAGDRVCIPSEATLAQVRDVVIRYLQEHPEERHYAASSLSLRALVLAFPCK